MLIHEFYPPNFIECIIIYELTQFMNLFWFHSQFQHIFAQKYMYTFLGTKATKDNPYVRESFLDFDENVNTDSTLQGRLGPMNMPNLMTTQMRNVQVSFQ